MIYLDNAATTFPKPKGVIDIVNHTLQNGLGTPGRGTYSTALKAGDAVNQVRRMLAKFFGVLEDYRVVFTYSATDALNMAIKGFIEEGDHVIISTMEHNSISRQAIRLAQSGVISLDIVDTDDKGYIDIDDFKSRFNAKTSLVAISHASNVTGAVQDIDLLSKITHEQGAIILIDAAQSVGVLPIDVRKSEIDFLAFSGHKGLMGTQGSGGLVIGERIRKLRPFREGGTGFDSESETQPVSWPEAYESGTHNVLGILSMGEGLKFIKEHGIENIAAAEMRHLKKIYEELSNMDSVVVYGADICDNRIAVLSFNIKGWESTDVGDILNLNHNVSLRCGLHCSPLAHKRLGTFPTGTVRVSPGYFNTDSDIDTFLKAVKMLARMEVPVLDDIK